MKSTLAALILLSSSAYASEPDFNFSSRDWKVVGEKEDPFLGVPSCRVYSTRSSPGNDVQISLSFPKGHVRAPLAVVSMSERRDGQKVQLDLAGRSQVALPLTDGESESGKRNFWYIPVDMERLLAQMTRNNLLNLQVVSPEGLSGVQVSMIGVSLSLQETEKCMGTNSLFNKQFFVELNDPQVQALEVNGSVSSVRLNDLFQMSYMFFHSIDGIKQDLSAIEENNRELLSAEKEALGVYNSAKASLDSVQGRLKQGIERVGFLASYVQKSKSDLVGLESSLPKAEAEYRDLAAKYEPIKQKLDDLQKEVNRLKSAKLRLEKDILSNQQEVTSSNRDLEKLKADLEQTSAQLLKVEGENSVLQEKKANSDQRLASFRVDEQVYSRVNAHGRVAEARQEIDHLRTQLPPLEAVVRQAQEEQIQAQYSFESCRRNSMESQEQGCNHEMARLRSAQADFSHKQSGLRSVNVSIAKLESEISDIRQGLRAQVIKEWSVLDTENKVLAERLSKIGHKIRVLNNKKSELATLRIPGTEQRLSELTNKVQGLESDLVNTTSSLENYEGELQGFIASSNQKELFKTLNASHSEWRRQSELKSSLEKGIVDAGKETERILKERSELESREKSHLQAVTEAEKTLLPLQEKTKGLHEKSAVLTERLEGLLSQYELTRGHYRYVYERLIEN